MDQVLSSFVIPTLATAGVYAFAFVGMKRLDKLPSTLGMVSFLLLMLALVAGAVWFFMLFFAVAAMISPTLAIGMIVVIFVGAKVAIRAA